MIREHPENGFAETFRAAHVREIEFLDDLNVAILSERRVVAPCGR